MISTNFFLIGAIQVIEQTLPKTGLDNLHDLRQGLYALEAMRAVLAIDFPILLASYDYAQTQPSISGKLCIPHLRSLKELPVHLDELLTEMRCSMKEALEKFTEKL